jgi:hypothetical protein
MNKVGFAWRSNPRQSLNPHRNQCWTGSDVFVSYTKKQTYKHNPNSHGKHHCCVSDPNPHSMAALIRGSNKDLKGRGSAVKGQVRYLAMYKNSSTVKI